MAYSKNKGFYYAPLLLVGLICIAHLADILIPVDFNRFGIRPRSLNGLMGVPISVFLHGDFKHLINNMGPLLVLGVLLRTHGRQTFIRVTTLLILISGFFTWCFSSAGIVIGASGLVFAYWAFLITKAIKDKTFLTMILALIALVFYWGLAVSLTNIQEGVSWAGHASGVIAGIGLALYGRRL